MHLNSEVNLGLGRPDKMFRLKKRRKACLHERLNPLQSHAPVDDVHDLVGEPAITNHVSDCTHQAIPDEDARSSGCNYWTCHGEIQVRAQFCEANSVHSAAQSDMSKVMTIMSLH